ncbi:hypothetical protein Phi47:1_gp03 [Cellulophaga phage phi47:1]|nr:hypothetical protein Phi3ST:2_gp3 [Cellulophaga phage phi3ST:2]AGO48198.1 hypothetical protein PhiSM_gp03 [Cellulophaga phage phiSM]AGO49242.1 hypothetical protein Phi38:2_gp03 [Cellulophaga phage phi38:2]AGO49322.1 hypothetical protein Phi3:1_gp3 [Cellulophaga phage phi3:1]AGO49740.1 hypothetical protein Phi47:1_gp03 [Cellulophaga phage phi47:1]
MDFILLCIQYVVFFLLMTLIGLCLMYLIVISFVFVDELIYRIKRKDK